MSILVIKLNATGDVVRTSTLLHPFASDHVTWITAAPNDALLPGPALRVIDWNRRHDATDREYDLVVNLEDEVEPAAFARGVRHGRLFGALLRDDGTLAYSGDSSPWFDLSLISRFGRERADELKLLNRRSYQDLLFEALGFSFTGQPYRLPPPPSSPLAGDVAIAPVAGPVWPMKGWAYYDRLKTELERSGLAVNVLPRRATLLEHLADVVNHRCLVSGDSLPMHLALGTGTPCVTIFNCTSPWEIHDYGVQTKLVSPLLERYFYKRGFEEAATTAIRLDEVFGAVMERLTAAAPSGYSPARRQDDIQAG